MRRRGLVRITPVVAGVTPVSCNSPASGRRIQALSGKIRDILLLTICLTTLILLSSCGNSSNSSSSSSSGGMSVSSGSGQSATVGTAFGAHFVAKVTIGGSGASGVAVTFAAPSSGASGTFANGKATEIDTTDASGLATSTTFTANSITGEYAVTATATASGQSASVNFGVANTAAPVLVVNAANGSQQTALVGTAFTLPLSAVVDQNGLPVSGVTVTFTAPSSGASGTFANGTTTETDVTGSNGIATSSALTANGVAGQYQVTASISGGATANLVLTNTSASQLNLAVANGSQQSTNVGTAFTTPLQVRVAIAGAGIPGVTVVFSAPTSGATGTFSNHTATESDVTDSNGLATASTFTANNVVGQYQVTASISGGPSGILYLTNTAVAGVPAAVQAVGGTPQTTVVETQFASKLMAEVVDGTNAPLSGVSVTFTAPSSGATAIFLGSGTSTETDITNSNGIATTSTLTANSTSGNFTVNATVTGVAAPATFSLTNAPFAVVATGGTPQRTAVGTAFASLIATAVDPSGNPVSGASVNFAAPASGPSGTFSNGTIAQTVITDSNGHATVGFTANSTAGAPYNVTATVGTVTPANFALMNTASGVTGYTFYLSGQEQIDFQNHLNFYAVAGTILVDSSGNVVGGEEDYNDADGFTFPNVGITGGSFSFLNTDPPGQRTLTLITNNTQIGSSGTETFKVQFVNTNHALMVQFDGTATSSGTLDVQTLGAPTGGYAFTLSGVDPNYLSVGFGGVFAPGGTLLNPQWPGTLDVADAPSPGLGIQTAIPFTASLGTMDVYGRGVITGIAIPVTGQSPLNLNIAYYQVGTRAMRLIDIDSSISAAGSAFAQGTNATAASNAGLGQSVFAIAGNTNPATTNFNTFFVGLGQFSTSNTSLPTADLAGVADEDELAKAFAQAKAITGTYQVQLNGYGSLSITSGNLGNITSLGMYFTDPTLNLNDPNNTSTGLGGALLLDLDATLTGGIGIITPQTDTSVVSFDGNYAVGWQDINELDGVQYPREFDMLAEGPMVASGALNLTGAFSDPFETLSALGTLSTGDTCQSIPKADNNGTGRYSMLEANLPQNALDCELYFGSTKASPNFEVIMYQASGTQLFWYQRSLEPDRPAQLFLGPLEQQGSLNGIPAARKRTSTLKSTGAADGTRPDSQ